MGELESKEYHLEDLKDSVMFGKGGQTTSLVVEVLEHTQEET